MSNHSRDYDKMMALLKSVAAPCDGGADDHAWRQCRHCLAVQEFERTDIRKLLRTFIDAVTAMDAEYGKVKS
jgi:hypothetical protein